MSKSIHVIVRDKTTIVIQEDATKGDYIDLSEVSEFDMAYLEQLVEAGHDKVYNKKLAEYKENFNKEQASAIQLALMEASSKYEKQINELKFQQEGQIAKLKEAYLQSQNDAVKKENQKYQQLNEAYIKLESEFNAKVMEKEQNIKSECNAEINALKNQLENLQKESKSALELELTKEKANTLEQINNLKEKHNQELKEKEELIQQLKNQKASLNVKQIGEDLESWCNNEVVEQMQNGFLNCTWEKDNQVVREEDEKKGSKADYIFKVYATELHHSEELLTSVCLDMKDENPDSTIKQTNEHYYKALDKNRTKKMCKYAVLVSNLEADKPNALPIFKVREYPDMYVVRPGYLMTFLHMVTSLSVYYKELLLKKESEKLELKNKLDFLSEFEKIKNTYLDKPLDVLEAQIEKITKSSEAITKANEAIKATCDDMISKYINSIQEKLAKFDAKLNQNFKKYSIE